MIDKGLAARSKFAFKPFCAVAVATGPRFRAVRVSALASVVCVLNARHLEVLFPVGAFFLERHGTVANFNPSDQPVDYTGVAHVPQVLAFGNRARSEGPCLYCAQERPLASSLNASSNQIAHAS